MFPALGEQAEDDKYSEDAGDKHTARDRREEVLKERTSQHADEAIAKNADNNKYGEAEREGRILHLPPDGLMQEPTIEHEQCRHQGGGDGG